MLSYGECLITGHEDGSIRIWNDQGNQYLKDPSDECIETLEINTYFLLVKCKKEVEIWDLHIRKWISSFNTMCVRNVKFINNTTLLCSYDQILQVTDLLGNKSQLFDIDDHIDYMCIENSPIIVHFQDDMPTIFNSVSNSIKIYDTGKLLYESKSYSNI